MFAGTEGTEEKLVAWTLVWVKMTGTTVFFGNSLNMLCQLSIDAFYEKKSIYLELFRQKYPLTLRQHWRFFSCRLGLSRLICEGISVIQQIQNYFYARDIVLSDNISWLLSAQQ